MRNFTLTHCSMLLTLNTILRSSGNTGPSTVKLLAACARKCNSRQIGEHKLIPLLLTVAEATVNRQKK